jgi:hypothetical protein
MYSQTPQGGCSASFGAILFLRDCSRAPGAEGGAKSDPPEDKEQSKILPFRPRQSKNPEKDLLDDDEPEPPGAA